MDTEPLFLLMLLFFLQRDPSAREAVQGFLGFYRENRDLISLFQKPKPASAPKEETAQKNRPPEESGDGKILEELLKRCEF